MNNSQFQVWRNSDYAPDCGACHSSKYRIEKHLKVEEPKVYYSLAELQDCNGSCHMYDNNSFSSIKEARSGKHTIAKDGW